MTALKKHEDNIVPFSKGKKMADKFDKGYVMSSRLYRNEVEPFLSDAAMRIYARLENYLTGFNKESDYVSYSQLQGNKNLVGSRTLGRATVAKGLKELTELGVISIIGSHPKFGNKYLLNEVSLVEKFSKKTSSKSKLVQKVNRTSSESEPQPSSPTEHSIDITYRYLNIDIYISPLRSNKLIVIFNNSLFLEKQEQAKAEAERKEKARKLSFDEVIQLTSEKFKNLCDFDLWEQYVSSRSLTAKTKLTKNALNTIFKDFQKWGFEGSNQSLKTSITGNYQGLFEPKQQSAFVPTQNNRNVNQNWGQVQHYAPATDDIDLGDLK